MQPIADFSLDISGEVCPLTFVRTKLLIERMTAGQTAEILLKGTEPVANVPRAVRAHGHTVLHLEVADEPSGLHRLLIRKEPIAPVSR